MTRIFIEDHELDVDQQLSNYITYAIDDLNNLDSKSTPFTKTIILPGTTNNNSVLGNIFEIANSNFTTNAANVGYNYNASRAARCRIEVDGLQIIKGVFRLLEIIIDGQSVEYECSVFGELGGFVASLANKRVEDLDFSAYDHDYTLENITESWIGRYVITASSGIQFGSYVFNSITYYYISIADVDYNKFKEGDILQFPASALNTGTYTVLYSAYQNGSAILGIEEALVNEYLAGPTVYDIYKYSAAGSGFCYPLIDYGFVSTNKHDYQYTAFRPALHLREFLDKIITGNGYTWECDMWDTAFFKRLIIPNNDKALTKYGITSYIHGEYAPGSTSGTWLPQPPNFSNYLLPFPTNQTLNNFSAFNNYYFTHLGATNINVKITLRVIGQYFYAPPSAFTGEPYFNAGITIITSQRTEEYILPYYYTSPFENQHYNQFDKTIELIVPMAPGETIQCWAIQEGATNQVNIFDMVLDVVKEPAGFIELLLGDPVTMNIGLPKGLLQKDFFASVLKMFYLMVTEDKFKEKHLVIKPWVDFFDTNRDTYLDWSDKIDRSEPIRIKPMSELNARYYVLKFKEDNDYYNETYRKKWNLGYGDYKFDTAYDFAKETETVDVIFSSSPLIAASGEDKITPAIFKKSGTTEDTMPHNIRIMQKLYIFGLSSYDILNNATVLGSYNEYLYGGHFDDPDAPDSDINFGATNELYFTLVSGNLSNNLFNAYYSPYMAEITDKDSRVIKAKFKLSKQDVFELDFSKFIYIDGALFRLSKVLDYNTNGEDLATIELLRVIYTTY
jgi:hypothetical protein